MIPLRAVEWMCDCGMGRESLIHLQGCARSCQETRDAVVLFDVEDANEGPRRGPLTRLVRVTFELRALEVSR